MPVDRLAKVKVLVPMPARNQFNGLTVLHCLEEEVSKPGYAKAGQKRSRESRDVTHRRIDGGSGQTKDRRAAKKSTKARTLDGCRRDDITACTCKGGKAHLCYHRRRPERTLLYRTVQTHFGTWLALTRDRAVDSDPVPVHVARVSGHVVYRAVVDKADFPADLVERCQHLGRPQLPPVQYPLRSGE